MARVFPTSLLDGNDALGDAGDRTIGVVSRSAQAQPEVRDDVDRGVRRYTLGLMETHMRIAALTVLVGTLCLAACDDTNNVISVPTSRSETFILQTVNGRALPVTIADSISPPLRIDVLSGAIFLTTTNGFTDVTTFRQTLDTVVTTPTVSCSGTFSVVGNVFTFVESVSAPQCGRRFTGSLNGVTLSASVLGVPAVFIR